MAKIGRLVAVGVLALASGCTGSVDSSDRRGASVTAPAGATAEPQCDEEAAWAIHQPAIKAVSSVDPDDVVMIITMSATATPEPPLESLRVASLNVWHADDWDAPLPDVVDLLCQGLDPVDHGYHVNLGAGQPGPDAVPTELGRLPIPADWAAMHQRLTAMPARLAGGAKRRVAADHAASGAWYVGPHGGFGIRVSDVYDGKPTEPTKFDRLAASFDDTPTVCGRAPVRCLTGSVDGQPAAMWSHRDHSYVVQAFAPQGEELSVVLDAWIAAQPIRPARPAEVSRSPVPSKRPAVRRPATSRQ